MPSLDVIVAQSGGTLHVWYSARCPGSVATAAVQGAVDSIINFQVIIKSAHDETAVYRIDVCLQAFLKPGQSCGPWLRAS